MQIITHKRLYLPAITITAIVLLLLVMIAVSTFRTLNHQKETALAFVHSQGVTLLHALESAALTGMQTHMWHEDTVARLIHAFGKNRNIANIYIYDQSGTVSHDSNVPMKGARAAWRPEIEHDDQVVARLTESRDGAQVYELAKRFAPLAHAPQRPASQSGGGDDEVALPDHHAGHTVVVSMSMEEFETAHHMDVQHAIIMGAILLVLGTAVLFFTFVIQNYYLVEKAFNQSRDYLRQVVASMPNGMLSIDAQGKITSINGPASRLLGIAQTGIKHQDLRSVLDFQTSGIARTLAQGTPVVEKEVVIQNPSGQVPLVINAAPIVRQNKTGPYPGAVIILRDLSEIRQLQEKVRRSEKLAGIGALAATVAHEVRNPLSSIRGFARFLAHLHKDRPQEREYAELMVNEVDRINNVVTNLLTFAHPVRPEPVPTDLVEVLDHAVRLVQEDARMRDITINVAAPRNLGTVHVDGNQITQALLNLVLNALQSVEAGGRITVGAEKTGPDWIELTVEDDGPGIAPDDLRLIFEPFFTTREKGTGLGLAIVRTIVENHGGDIHVTSPIPGKRGGSRFTIQIPISG